MAKKDNTLLWVGVALVGGYLLAPEKLKEQLGMPSIGINLGDLGSRTFETAKEAVEGLTGGVTGGLSADEIVNTIRETIVKFIPTVTPPKADGEAPPAPESGGGEEVLPIPETDIPEGKIDITNPAIVQPFLGRGMGIAGRQYAAASLTGTHLVRPLPFVSHLERGFAPLRTGAAKIAGKPIVGKGIVKGFTEIVTHPATGESMLRLTKTGLGKAASKTVTKAAITTAAKGGVKIGARAIPVVGWALTLVDAGADLLRVFGVDVTEWLGFSGMAEPFLGYNPIEKWAAEGTTKRERVSGIVNISETGYAPKEPAITSEKSYTSEKKRGIYTGKPSEPADVTDTPEYITFGWLD